MSLKPVIYQPPQIVDALIRQYNLSATSQLRDALRQKVKSVCMDIKVVHGGKEVSLWEKSEHQVKNPKTKNPPQIRHYFNSDEYRIILSSDDLRNYILKNLCDSKTAKEYCEAASEAEKRNIEYEKYLSDVDFYELSKELAEQEEQDELTSRYDVVITWEDVKKKKFEMMIEAIFTKLYGGKIDMDKLMDDMLLSDIMDDRHNTAESVLAQKRLTDVNYYIKESE